LIYCQSNSSINEFPFGFHEKLSFEVQYHLGPAWLKVGSFELIADTLNLNNKAYYHFKSETKTNSKWRWLYDISSNYESISDLKTLKPLKYYQNTSYGRHFESYDYNFFSDSIYLSAIKDEKTSELTLNNQKSIFDALSSLYLARSLDFSNLKENDSIEINILHGEEFLNQKIIFEGIVDLVNDDGKTYECFKFTSYIKNNNIISETDPAQVWVTTEKERLPIKVSTEIFAGSVNIYLKTFNSISL
jgi:hypothetical protein